VSTDRLRKSRCSREKKNCLKKCPRFCRDCPELVETTVFPTVGENLDKQYVCLTLAVIFSPNYPNEVPKFRISSPRGLSDQCLATIEQAIVEKLNESLGQPVVFDLIEVVRDHLTESNLPTGQCVICLYGFCEGETTIAPISLFKMMNSLYIFFCRRRIHQNRLLPLLAQPLLGVAYDGQ
jgi:RWD domain